MHIPFCVRKCIYCDFLSAPCTRAVQEKYVEAMLGEMQQVAEEQAEILQKYQVFSIFFGGGTPSVLEAEWIAKILLKIRQLFRVSEDAEITVECNPGTIDEHKAQVYFDSGVNRISFGLQSANNTELQMLGRIHTFEEFEESLRIVKAAGFTNINVDLMSAIPGQTVISYKNTVQKVLACDVQHISSYSLIIEEGTYLEEHLEEFPPLPDEDAEREMYAYTKQALQEAGYQQYEISNYAKPGFVCRHNLSYWERTDYLGFGVGAASLFEECRYTNLSDIEQYIQLYTPTETILEAVCNTVKDTKTQSERYAEWRVLSKEEQMEEFMFLGLRKIEGVSQRAFEKKFQVSMQEVYGTVLDKYQKNGLLIIDGDAVYLAPHGIEVSNVIMADFLLT